MRRVVVTGLGFITSIGNSKAEVLHSLRELKTGIEPFSEFAGPESPVKLAGTVKGFDFPTPDCEDWTIPEPYQLGRSALRSMGPNAVFGYCAMQQAIDDAKLPPEIVSHPRTGALCSSAGSMWMSYEHLHTMVTRGVQKTQPLGLVASISGTLNINLGALFKIKGSCWGIISACSSSAHGLGSALDLIRLGRQDVMFVVGAEDHNKYTGLPFAGIRALSTGTDPEKTPCAFDKKRDGFVFTGGATTLVLEELDHAQKRGATIYAEVIGWGEASDGYNIMAPDPTGDGLTRAMRNALADARISPGDVDYINAHATSTPPGDKAEIEAVRAVFDGGKIPYISSTKSLTGHGLCLAGAMEAGFTTLAIAEKFTPVSAHITELDPMCEGIPVVTRPVDAAPRIAMSNSSGFGGANVSLVFKEFQG
ncbi:MAG: beta-ketoacyl-[acyl-carrier-protein] synthase family protein [Verrucomicrobium sp.]|nr:beta-ketoacyl-[acyl-carrier-protein] synthase family protein [Verrucomicrobium sp.]